MSNNNEIKARDTVWEEVLELLSSQGRLSRYFKLPKNEKKAIAQLYSAKATLCLGKIFSMTQQGKRKEREVMLAKLGPYEHYALLAVLLQSMQCWAETDGLIRQKAPSRWKVAHA